MSEPANVLVVEDLEAPRSGAALAGLAKDFDEEIASDLQQWPRCSILVPASAIHRYELARLVRVTLRVLRRHGDKGVAVALLRQVYEALEVPWTVAEHVERKLSTDGVGGTTGGRLVFTGTRESWSRLAATAVA